MVGGHTASVERGAGLVLSSVTREDEGTYVCTASNGVGSPASASTSLTVLCELRVELETKDHKKVPKALC